MYRQTKLAECSLEGCENNEEKHCTLKWIRIGIKHARVDCLNYKDRDREHK